MGADFPLRHLDGHVEGLSGDLGSGLFCQFVDIGDGGDDGFGLVVEFDGAESAIGLEGAKLLKRAVVSAPGAGLVAAETVEDGGGLRVGEVVEGAEPNFGFDGAEAVKVPGGVEELLEGDGLDGALGGELGEERIAEGLEVFALVLAPAMANNATTR